jgi:hypothetical protein
LGRVVLGGFLQSLNGGISLLVKLLEVGLGVPDAVVEVAREGIADAVDTVYGQMKQYKEVLLYRLTLQVRQQRQFPPPHPSSSIQLLK